MFTTLSSDQDYGDIYFDLFGTHDLSPLYKGFYIINFRTLKDRQQTADSGPQTADELGAYDYNVVVRIS